MSAIRMWALYIVQYGIGQNKVRNFGLMFGLCYGLFYKIWSVMSG